MLPTPIFVRSRWRERDAVDVILHGQWQRSRGRNPSESYKGECNPRKAYELALDELRAYKPTLEGMRIQDFITRIIFHAQLLGERVSGTFNGISIQARADSNPTELVKQWRSLARKAA